MPANGSDAPGKALRSLGPPAAGNPVAARKPAGRREIP